MKPRDCTMPTITTNSWPITKHRRKPRLLWNPQKLSTSGEHMPKIKTHRGTAKRVKVSANGKVMHRHQFSGCGHIMSKRTQKRKRNFRKDQPVFAGDLKRFAPQIPYML